MHTHNREKILTVKNSITEISLNYYYQNIFAKNPLESILQKFSSDILKLTLFCYNDKDEINLQILKTLRTSKLKSLKAFEVYSNYTCSYDNQLILLNKIFPQLKNLEILGLPHKFEVDENILSLPLLKKIDFARGDNSNNLEAYKNPHIKKLNDVQIYPILDNKEIFPYLDKVEILNLENLKFIYNAFVYEFPDLQSLHTIDTSYVYLDDITKEILTKLPTSINKIIVSYDQMEIFDLIKNNPQIITVEFTLYDAQNNFLCELAKLKDSLQYVQKIDLGNVGLVFHDGQEFYYDENQGVYDKISALSLFKFNASNNPEENTNCKILCEFISKLKCFETLSVYYEDYLEIMKVLKLEKLKNLNIKTFAYLQDIQIKNLFDKICCLENLTVTITKY